MKYIKRFINWLLRVQNKPNKYNYLEVKPHNLKGCLAAIIYSELDIDDLRLDECVDQICHLLEKRGIKPIIDY